MKPRRNGSWPNTCSKLPADSYVRQFLEAQDATGDSSLPADMFKPKDEKHSPAYLEYQDAKTAGYAGSFAQYQNEDANRKRPVTQSRWAAAA